tara:strand:+ start:294 stop:503 length:210 start_codon:yes stop_codon:yes gene_type:complete
MDMFLNYIFIGFIFTFILDLILYKLKDNITVKELGLEESWGDFQRIVCILIWPISLTVFLLSFIKSSKK